MTDFSRRGFIGALAAAGSVAALPAPIRKAALADSTDRMVNGAAGALKVGDVFTISGMTRWDVTWGKEVLRKFRVTAVADSSVSMAEDA